MKFSLSAIFSSYIAKNPFRGAAERIFLFLFAYSPMRIATSAAVSFASLFSSEALISPFFPKISFRAVNIGVTYSIGLHRHST